MKISIITSSPNKDGLMAACGRSAVQGAEDMGAQVVYIDLNAVNVGKQGLRKRVGNLPQ